MGYIGSDPKNNESVSTSQLVDDSVTNAKIVDNVLFTSVTSSIVSASGNITADTFTGTFNGALSSSAQIATSISGSSTSLSSSLSTRATTLESASGSFASDLVTLKGSGTAQGVGTSDSPTFADATITGTLTAQEVHTEFESASVIFTSGSTIFGNSSDDVHNMTGSLNVSGSITMADGDLSVTDDVVFGATATVETGLNLESGTFTVKNATSDSNGLKISQGGSDASNILNHYNGTLNLGVANSVDMTLKGGSVGIGTDNPGNPLHLYSDTYPQLSIDGTDNSGNIGFVLSGSGGRGGMRWNGSNNDVEILREGGAVEISLLDGGGTTFTGNVELTGTSGQHLKFADDGGSSWSGNHAKIQHHNSYMYLQGGSNGIILRTNSGTNALTMDSSGNTTFAGNTTVTADPGKLGVGAAVNSNVGSSMDVIQVGFTSQWYAEKTDSADRNVYIGNNFYHNGSYHRAIYEDQVCGIQFRAGDIKFRTTGSVPVTTNLEAGGGRARMVVHDDGRVSVGYDQSGGHDLEHDSALMVSSSGVSGPESRNAITAVCFCGAGTFNFGQSTVTFDNIKGDGPCFTLRNLGSSHTDRGPFQVYNGSTRILETRNDGLISGDFNDTSDRDFKQNINTITSSLKEVNELRPVTFVWKQDEENGQNRGHGQTKIGFIAQEVSESIPRLVSGVSGSSSGLGINTIGVTAVLTKAIQELTQAHKDLRAMITGSSDLGQLKALVSGSSFV
jgi:hypothetical protein